MKGFLFIAALLFNAIASADPATRVASEGLHGLTKREYQWLNGRSGQYCMMVPIKEYGQHLKNLLDILWTKIQPVVADAEKSKTQPSGAFTTFFKDPASAPTVAKLFNYITAGTAMFKPSEPDTNGSPTFVPLFPDTASFKLKMADGSSPEAYSICLSDRNTLAFTQGLTGPYIFLCPKFFEQPALPPDPIRCPVTTRRRLKFKWDKIVEPHFNGEALTWNYQLFSMLEEIVHYYLNWMVQQIKPERFDINEARRLSAADSLRNAKNYVYYAATLMGNCEDWPKPLTSSERDILTYDPVVEWPAVSDSVASGLNSPMDIVGIEISGERNVVDGWN